MVRGHKFTHYGKALTFARQLSAKIEIIETKNPLKWLMASI